jgi:hypothetical protein
LFLRAARETPAANSLVQQRQDDLRATPAAISLVQQRQDDLLRLKLRYSQLHPQVRKVYVQLDTSAGKRPDLIKL